jgi:hypothetical protein
MRNYAFSNATSSRSQSVNAYHTMPRWPWSRGHRWYLLPEARLNADMFLLCINRDVETSIRCFLDGSMVVLSRHWWFDDGLSAARKESGAAGCPVLNCGWTEQLAWETDQILSNDGNPSKYSREAPRPLRPCVVPFVGCSFQIDPGRPCQLLLAQKF